jgi:hypothetical protein
MGVRDDCPSGDDCIFGVKGKRFVFEVGDKLSDQHALACLVIPFAIGEGEPFLALTRASAADTLCFERVYGLEYFDPDRVVDGVVGDESAERRFRLAVGEDTFELTCLTPVGDCAV